MSLLNWFRDIFPSHHDWLFFWFFGFLFSFYVQLQGFRHECRLMETACCLRVYLAKMMFFFNFWTGIVYFIPKTSLQNAESLDLQLCLYVTYLFLFCVMHGLRRALIKFWWVGWLLDVAGGFLRHCRTELNSELLKLQSFRKSHHALGHTWTLLCWYRVRLPCCKFFSDFLLSNVLPVSWVVWFGTNLSCPLFLLPLFRLRVWGCRLLNDLRTWIWLPLGGTTLFVLALLVYLRTQKKSRIVPFNKTKINLFVNHGD